MNGDYELVMKADAVEILMTCSRDARQRIMNELHRLKSNPYFKGQRVIRDLSGREHQVHMLGKWEIVFWPDHAVKEIRVVRLRKLP